MTRVVELTRFWQVRAVVGSLGLICAVTVVVVAADLLGSSSDARIIQLFLVNLTAAVGLQIFVGTSGVLSLGYPALMAIGAYTAAILTTEPGLKAATIPGAPEALLDAHLGVVPAAALAVVVVATVALIVGIPIARLSGDAATVATWGLLAIGFVLYTNLDGLTGGAGGFFGVPPYSSLYVGLAFAACAILVARLARDSNRGLALRASRDDELAARASGVDVTRARLLMWVLSGAVAGLAGALYAGYVLTVLPRAFFLDATLVVVTMVLVGGQSITGAVVGAASVSGVSELLRRAEGGFTVGPVEVGELTGAVNIGVALLVVLTLIWRRQGLAGRWEIDEWLLARLRPSNRVHERAKEEAT